MFNNNREDGVADSQEERFSADDCGNVSCCKEGSTSFADDVRGANHLHVFKDGIREFAILGQFCRERQHFTQRPL